MLRKHTVIIPFDLFIPSRIPKIRLHADRLRIVSVFPDMVAETAVLEVDASAVILLNIRKRDIFFIQNSLNFWHMHKTIILRIFDNISVISIGQWRKKFNRKLRKNRIVALVRICPEKIKKKSIKKWKTKL